MKHKIIFLLSMLALYSLPGMAQLPELAMPTTVSGGSTTARFFGGASADNGASYASSFGYDQAIDIDMEIQVESAHVNTMGNLYVFIVWEDQYFQRVESGAYEIWDLTLENMQAAFPAKTLQASEPINIVDDVPFGPAGVSDTTLFLYVAYDTMAAQDEIFYSGSPLSVSIEAEQTSAASLELYTANISTQIIQAKCIVCHVSGGVAAATPLLYVNSATPDFMNTNYNTLVNYITTVPNGASLLIAKPQGQQSHTGGIQLTAGSQDLQNLQDFVNAVLSE